MGVNVMSRWSERDDHRREELRKYEADVHYDVWRSGGNVDRIDYDRVSDHYYEGLSEDEAADYELRKQRPMRDELEEFETPEPKQ